MNKMMTFLRTPAYLFRTFWGKMKEGILWDYYCKALPQPKIISRILLNTRIQDEIFNDFKNNSINVVTMVIDVRDYEQYLSEAEYGNFPGYYDGDKACNFPEKSLEHYLSAKLLDISSDDIYIDVANGGSPAPKIFRKLYGCTVFLQDLAFNEGLNGNVIGGDASNMPIEDGFATKMALHCSFEHFEHNSDIAFIKEATRVLRRGGKLCIIPLYMFNKYAIQTDPAVLPFGGISFDEDAVLYCAKGWAERHGRFYDVDHFVSRIVKNMQELNLTIFVVQNEKKVDSSCYVKFIALFEKE